MTSRITELRLVAGSALSFALLFVAFPAIDLAVAGPFARDGWHWLFAADSPWVDLPYRLTPWLGKALFIGLLTSWLGSFLPGIPLLRRQRLLAGFLLLAALLGPLLLVDSVLKNQFGRARPAQITVFGGERQFTAAFVVARECERNCSFVSGHVATAAFIMAFGWLGQRRTRRAWLAASLAAAGYMGLIRMATGSHFVSDCLFAWFAVYCSLWLSELLVARLSGVTRLQARFRLTASAAVRRLQFA